MRILIDATAAMSGGKVYLEHLLPPLLQLAREHEFLILHNGELAECAVPDEAARVQWRAIGGLSASHQVWIGKAFIKFLWRLFVLPYLLWRWQPDVFFSNAGFAPRWLPRRTRAVLALHNSMPLRAELIAAERSPLHRWRLQLLRQLIVRSTRRAAAVIVFSHDTRERLLACCGTLPFQPDVVYHGNEWQAGKPP
ncbi:MAG: glycosyltransferase, partial [Acidobacteria bacterium]|nr:glycosyltransferase [Acidobacteriota bacterium]